MLAACCYASLILGTDLPLNAWGEQVGHYRSSLGFLISTPTFPSFTPGVSIKFIIFNPRDLKELEDLFKKTEHTAFLKMKINLP